LKIQSIFTPNDIPTVTYVTRDEQKLEDNLKQHYETPNLIVSVSGPSKSGKTVLIKKVIPEEYLITIAGAGITSPENVWERALNWMERPIQTIVSTSASDSVSISAEAGGKAKIPFVAEGGAKAAGSGSHTSQTARSETYARHGLPQVISEIGGSEFAIFIDDFHYIKSEFRDEIGKQIKAAAENGVKIVTASVPHRAEDVVRSNPELRGRVAAVNLSYWNTHELTEIARKGFYYLNTEIAPDVEKQFANEAFGSPQLMQSICLNLCYTVSLTEKFLTKQRINTTPTTIASTLERTSSFTDFSKMISALHTGPRTRGTERKIHAFTDGTKGDVYRAILLALKSDPAALSFSYHEILERVRAVCINDPPVGSSVTSALEQMQLLAEEVQPGSSPISWDDDTLDFNDPYLLFFLRCSDKLTEIVRA
jgi:hypothetical protein